MRVQAAFRRKGKYFGPPQTLSPPGQDASQPEVGLNETGSGVAVWQRLDGTNMRVQATFRRKGEYFGPPQTLSAPGQDASQPKVALDPAGGAAAVWQRYDGTNLRVEAAFHPTGFGLGPPPTLPAPGQDAAQP